MSLAANHTLGDIGNGARMPTVAQTMIHPFVLPLEFFSK